MMGNDIANKVAANFTAAMEYYNDEEKLWKQFYGMVLSGIEFARGMRGLELDVNYGQWEKFGGSVPEAFRFDLEGRVYLSDYGRGDEVVFEYEGAKRGKKEYPVKLTGDPRKDKRTVLSVLKKIASQVNRWNTTNKDPEEDRRLYRQVNDMLSSLPRRLNDQDYNSGVATALDSGQQKKLKAIKKSLESLSRIL